MADTALLRKKLQARIQALMDQLREAEEQLAAVDAVEALDRKWREGAAETAPKDRPNATWTTANVAAYVLANEMKGEGHGKAILNGIMKYKALGGAHPMEALAAAMTRDDRFERVAGQPNYWRLKQL